MRSERGEILWENNVFKNTRGGMRTTIARLMPKGHKTTEQLKKLFGKDGHRLLEERNLGIRTLNVICQIIGRFDCLRYSVERNICQLCGSQLTPHRNQREDKSWQFGYLCDCNETARGRTK